MIPEQKLRLRSAALCKTPINVQIPLIMMIWQQAKDAVREALKKPRSREALLAGMEGAVYIESCNAMEHYICPLQMQNGTRGVAEFLAVDQSAGVEA